MSDAAIYFWIFVSTALGMLGGALLVHREWFWAGLCFFMAASVALLLHVVA